MITKGDLGKCENKLSLQGTKPALIEKFGIASRFVCRYSNPETSQCEIGMLTATSNVRHDGQPVNLFITQLETYTRELYIYE
jgi:hypothetical protein